MQLNRCPSLNHYAYHSHEGGNVQFACTVGKYQLRDNKALYSLSSYTCPCTHTHTHISNTNLQLHTLRGIITIQYCSERNDWSFSVCYFFLPPSSRSVIFESGLKSGLKNSALQRCTFSFHISFSLCSIYHSYMWHSLHKQAHKYYTHGPMIHVPVAVLISSPWSSSSCARTQRTHTAMNHRESWSPNSTQGEVLHLFRTWAIYNGLGVQILIIGHRGR